MVATLRRYLVGFFFLLFLVGCLFVAVRFYPFIFSKKVTGEILKIERVQLNVALMQGSESANNPSLFSFAVSIKDETGEIYTASAEDRQWAAAQAGLCAEARYFRYPPWEVMKAGTFFNARLDRLFECPGKPKPVESTAPPAAVAPPSLPEAKPGP